MKGLNTKNLDEILDTASNILILTTAISMVVIGLGQNLEILNQITAFWGAGIPMVIVGYLFYRKLADKDQMDLPKLI